MEFSNTANNAVLLENSFREISYEKFQSLPHFTINTQQLKNIKLN